MNKIPFQKYKSFPPVKLTDRTWPDTVINEAPTWCSVDLRDGNQALINPLGAEEKLHFFKLLTDIGFKEIEIGFPSASQTEYDFVRRLIEEEHIPHDVTVQVLVQSREHLILRTFEALRHIKRVIIHLYNSTSELQRRVVFQKSRKEIIDIAVTGARLIKELAPTLGQNAVVYQYSPESFTGTELDFAVDICSAVAEVWQPDSHNKMIVNLPATMEMSTPNVYADQIQWFCRNFAYRESSIISLHTHNDRGTAVAAAELGLMAGGDRVEGTLFGNGERTGNVDLVTLALNLLSQGVNPRLDFSNIREITKQVQRYNNIVIHPRHPYAGDLVFTAFSGSHQDAIRKGLAALQQSVSQYWEVPYLPMDPRDLGRDYEPLVRINSQSGKGGISFILEEYFGILLPRGLQIEFSQVIQKLCDETSKELVPEDVKKAFESEYFIYKPFALKEHTVVEGSELDGYALSGKIVKDNCEYLIKGNGNGPVSALLDAIENSFGIKVYIYDYYEHALGAGMNAAAITYIRASINDGSIVYGVGMHTSTEKSALLAVISALNRGLKIADLE